MLRISNIFINNSDSALLTGLVNNVVQSGRVVLQDVGTPPQQGGEITQAHVVGALHVIVEVVVVVVVVIEVDVVITGKSIGLLMLMLSVDGI